MNWVPCTFEHIMQIQMADQQANQDIRDYVKDTEEFGAILQESAKALIDDGRTIAAVGISPMWKGVGTAWALLSIHALKKPLFLTRSVLQFLHQIEQAGELRRIEAAVNCEHSASIRWIEVLGFVREGTMKNYGVGGSGDFDLYARTH